MPLVHHITSDFDSMYPRRGLFIFDGEGRVDFVWHVTGLKPREFQCDYGTYCVVARALYWFRAEWRRGVGLQWFRGVSFNPDTIVKRWKVKPQLQTAFEPEDELEEPHHAPR